MCSSRHTLGTTSLLIKEAPQSLPGQTQPITTPGGSLRLLCFRVRQPSCIRLRRWSEAQPQCLQRRRPAPLPTPCPGLLRITPRLCLGRPRALPQALGQGQVEERTLEIKGVIKVITTTTTITRACAPLLPILVRSQEVVTVPSLVQVDQPPLSHTRPQGSPSAPSALKRVQHFRHLQGRHECSKNAVGRGTRTSMDTRHRGSAQCCRSVLLPQVYTPIEAGFRPRGSLTTSPGAQSPVATPG